MSRGEKRCIMQNWLECISPTVSLRLGFCWKGYSSGVQCGFNRGLISLQTFQLWAVWAYAIAKVLIKHSCLNITLRVQHLRAGSTLYLCFWCISKWCCCIWSIKPYILVYYKTLTAWETPLLLHVIYHSRQHQLRHWSSHGCKQGVFSEGPLTLKITVPCVGTQGMYRA